MAKHALITGPIAGRIPVDHPAVKDGHVDVTPDVLYFDHDDESDPPEILHVVAAAIDAEHRVRGTHPEQVED